MDTIIKAEYINDITRKEKLYRGLELLKALFLRDFKARYRRSQLGVLWNFIQPLLTMVIYVILRALFRISNEGAPFILFILSTVIPWQFFSQVSLGAPNYIMGNTSIFRKISVPHEVFPMIGVAISMVDLLISLGVLGVIIAIYQISIGFNIFWLPILVIMLVLFSFGIGLLLTAIGVYKSDILTLSFSIFQVWFFLSPIFYPISVIPEEFRSIYVLNPMVGLLIGFRNVLAMGKSPDLPLLIPSLIGIIVIWAIAWPLFKRVAPYFGDVL